MDLKIERDTIVNCLICSGEVEVGGTQSLSKIDKQVHVIFILNKVLELPSSELVGYLQRWGNPECWIQLCENCNEDVEHIKKIYWKLNDISQKWDEGKRALQEKVRCSNTRNGKESQLSPIAKECLKFICQPEALKFEVNEEENGLEDVQFDFPELDCNDDNEETSLTDQPNSSSVRDETGQSKSSIVKEETGQSKSHSVREEKSPDSSPRKKVERRRRRRKDYDSDCWTPIQTLKKKCRTKKKKIVASFKCETCSKKFTNQISLRAHVAFHVKSNDKTCNQCGKPFKGNGELDRHLLTAHGLNPNKKFRCPVQGCSRMFDRQQPLQNHVAKHSDIESVDLSTQDDEPDESECGSGEEERESIRDSKRDGDWTVEGWKNGWKVGVGVKCGSCPKNFKNQIALRAHVKKCHTEQNTCSHCGKVLEDEGELDRHLLEVHKPKEKIACPVEGCSKTFARKDSAYEGHVSRHTGQEPGFKCTQCEGAFHSLNRLKRHTQLVHLRSGAAQCEKCGKEVSRRSHLAKHMEICGTFECEICGRKFTNLSRFKLHEKKKHRKAPGEGRCICHICGRSYSDKQNLKTHVTLVHEKNFTIFCHLCGKGMHESSMFKRHLARIHHIGDFKCEVEGCTEVFGSQYYLTNHIKYIHEGQQRPKRNISCTFCEFKACTSSSLKIHLACVHQIS